MWEIALESAHAVWGAIQLAKTLPKDSDVVMVCSKPAHLSPPLTLYLAMQCLSGRGDKDVEQISRLLPGKWADLLDWHPNEMPKTE